MSLSATSSFQAGDIASLVARISTAATEGARKTAETVLFLSQVAVPIRTGALQRSGNIEVVETPEQSTAYVNYDEPYAGFVEFGTYRMSAQPYLRPSLDGAHDLLLIATKAEVEAVL